jgi:DNA-binding beta-propeller fold protein YncE
MHSEATRQARRAARIAAILAPLALLLCAASEARATGRVYWTSYGSASIGFANLDGSGGANLSTGGVGIAFPTGIALDPAAGRVYWANRSNSGAAIKFADLGGGGGGTLATGAATVADPYGLAVNPAAGTAYWADQAAGGKIKIANLDATGGGVLTSPATVPAGVALRTSSGKIFFADSDQISFARLDGTGGGNLATGAATVSDPIGVAIDTASGRIYWANNNNAISYAALDGSGGGDLDITGAVINSPYGLAIDPTAGRVYWANLSGPISYASLNGGGGGTIPLGTATLQGSSLLTLLDVPSNTAAPAISGNSAPGSVLTCSDGQWAGNQPGAQYFRAPHALTYQWSRDGADLAGAVGATYTADVAGEYRCTVTASNAAGATPKASEPFTVSGSSNPPPPNPPSNDFSFGKLKRNKHAGTAKLTVDVPGPGTLALSGNGIAPINARALRVASRQTVGTAGPVKLKIRARGKARKRLKRSGKAKLTADVTYTPTGGEPNTLSKKIKLVRKR